ncbi:hypothetical protein GGX14DRAFT_396930 [Mycena pura]|uniref:Uncharacterized protein n=1 Tax=Mycena pura TaxID=153505 RepID=A0AAD6VDA1_9AGAR|nr:hypothetical protein GGX14DRAFT_396930 [Mycena pura]
MSRHEQVNDIVVLEAAGGRTAAGGGWRWPAGCRRVEGGGRWAGGSGQAVGSRQWAQRAVGGGRAAVTSHCLRDDGFTAEGQLRRWTTGGTRRAARCGGRRAVRVGGGGRWDSGAAARCLGSNLNQVLALSISSLMPVHQRSYTVTEAPNLSGTITKGPDRQLQKSQESARVPFAATFPRNSSLNYPRKGYTYEVVGKPVYQNWQNILEFNKKPFQNSLIASPRITPATPSAPAFEESKYLTFSITLGMNNVRTVEATKFWG